MSVVCPGNFDYRTAKQNRSVRWRVQQSTLRHPVDALICQLWQIRSALAHPRFRCPGLGMAKLRKKRTRGPASVPARPAL